MADINTAGVDPTKIGVGRAIAVLTSGGDAQGKQKVVICHLDLVLVPMVVSERVFKEMPAWIIRF